MRKFENAIVLLENLGEKPAISANDLVNVFSRIIEETEKDSGKTLVAAEVTDEAFFADGIAFLCGQLVEVIEAQRSAFASLPGVIRKLFDEDCRTIVNETKHLKEIQDQIRGEAEKRKEADNKRKEVKNELDLLEQEIAELHTIEDKITALEKDVEAKKKLLDDLRSGACEYESKIAEYYNSLTAVKNAWNSLSSRQDVEEMLKARGEDESIVPGIGSFEELQTWFRQYQNLLQSGIENYAKTYKKLLDILKN